jgi:hypothetical protein
MATAPTSRRLNLTRDQLATFLTDQQQIRQFELLFSTVDEIQVITGTDFEYQADTAAASANNALAQISALAQVAVTNVTGVAPVVSSGGKTPAISMAAASTSANGYLTSTDWNTFNNKGFGTVTSVAASVPSFLSITGSPITTSGTLAITYSGTALPVANGGTGTPTPSLVAGTNVTITGAWPNQTINASGGGGGSGTVTSVAALTLGTTGTDLSSTVVDGTTTPVITLNVPTASATNRGALSAADWTTFNNKGSGTVTSVTGTAPVVSSGGATPAISMAAASTSVNGYLTSTDWNTFNGKQPAGAYITATSTDTLTNKRITPRVSTTTSSATPTINTDNVDMYGLTAQAVDITSFTTNLSGTPTDGQKLQIYIVGTAARAITWGSAFEASTTALPTTTVTTNRLDIGFVWNAATSKWRCLASA